MSAGASVLVAVTVKTDPATAFTLFTRDVDMWWRRGPIFRFGRAGRLAFEQGPDGRHEGGRFVERYEDGGCHEVGRILAWEPGRRLMFSWRGTNYAPEETTEVEVRFLPSGDHTRVRVEHRGWQALAPDHPARHGLNDLPFLNNQGGWWRTQLDSLAHTVAGNRVS
jgi:uncharacterized protein YndB with AHSA1/START domain